MAHVTLQLLLALQGSKPRRKRIRIKPSIPSRANELWYKAELLKVVRYIRKIVEPQLLAAIKPHTFGGDALPSSISHTLNLLSNRFGGIEQTAKRLSRQAVVKNLHATDKQLIEHVKKALGVNIQAALTDDDVRDELRLAEQANIDLIKSIPAKYLDTLREGLDKSFEEGGRWESLSDYVMHVGDVTESRAKLIARDQTSKMNSSFNRVRQTSLGIKKYRWQTAGDERVRPTHRANDGKVFRWDNPPSETGNPGEDVNCRCVAIPEFDLDDEDDE